MGINNYYFKNIDARLWDVDNQDFWLSSDNQGQCLDYATKPSDAIGSFNIVEDGLVMWFDINNPNTTTDGSSLTSLTSWDNQNIIYSSGTTSNCGCYIPYPTNLTGITLCDWGLTGVDNGRFDQLSGITLTLTNLDNKVILYPVTGYTTDNPISTATKGVYDYPSTLISGQTTTDGCDVGNTLCLNGGFYQGFFKLDLEKPNPIEVEKTVDDGCGGTKTISEFKNPDPEALKYELGPSDFDCGGGNGGWSMETWIKWDNSNCQFLTGNTLNNNFTDNYGFFFYIGTRAENKFKNTFSGETGLFTCDGVIPLTPEDGPRLNTDGQDWFLTSGRFTKCGGEPNTNTNTGTTYCDELSENVLGFRITPEGKIGYRKITVDGHNYWCGDNPTDDKHFMITGSKIQEDYSDESIINTGDTWYHIVVTYSQNTIKHGLPAGTLRFWVNGRVVFRVEEFIGLKLRPLNEYSNKQLGVPYNISWGGGSQGLLESQTFGGPDPADNGLDIATNFAGTFEGELSQLRFYDRPLNLMEIRNNLYVDANRYCVKETYGGSLIKQPTVTFCDDKCLGNNTLIFSSNVGVVLTITIQLSPGSIVAEYIVKSSVVLKEELSLTFTNELNVISGDSITTTPTIIIPKDSDTGSITINIDEDYNRLASGYSNKEYVVVTNEQLDITFNDEIIYLEPLTVVDNNSGGELPQTGDTVVGDVKIYYGKLEGTEFNENSLPLLDITLKPNIVNSYLLLEEGFGYGYILIPESIQQPSLFRNSNEGCLGFAIPMLNMGEINLNVGNEETIYIVYRTFVPTHAKVDVWLCE